MGCRRPKPRNRGPLPCTERRLCTGPVLSTADKKVGQRPQAHGGGGRGPTRRFHSKRKCRAEACTGRRERASPGAEPSQGGPGEASAGEKTSSTPVTNTVHLIRASHPGRLCPLGDIWPCLETSLVVRTVGRADIWRVEVKDPTEHATMQRAPLPPQPH